MFCFFFFNDTATTEIYTLSLHDALPIFRRDFRRLAWFCLICGLNFFLILVVDAMVRSAIADRAAAMIVWKSIFVFLRALVTGWLLASWVVLFRQCESGRIAQENWIRY